MTLLRVDRSPVRLFLFGLVGLLLMIGAVDVMWGHWLSTPPDTYNDEITSKGRNQRRADYAWGAFMIVGGAGLFGYAVTSLIRRSPVLVLREDGVVLTVGPPGEEPTFVPWSAIASVSSAALPDPDGGYERDVLVIDVTDPAGLPAEPWGAVWDGNWLVIEADGWETQIGEVVIHAEIAMEHAHHFPQPVPAAPTPPVPAALAAGVSGVAETGEATPDSSEVESVKAGAVEAPEEVPDTTPESEETADD